MIAAVMGLCLVVVIVTTEHFALALQKAIDHWSPSWGR